MLNAAVIGLPPILNFGSQEIQDRYVPGILGGTVYIALAITEAFAGSDVAGVQTVAVRDGDDWVVTGTKKYGSFLIPPVMRNVDWEQVDHEWNLCGLLYHVVSNRRVHPFFFLFSLWSDGSYVRSKVPWFSSFPAPTTCPQSPSKRRTRPRLERHT